MLKTISLISGLLMFLLSNAGAHTMVESLHTLPDLSAHAHQFLVDRDWQQFHNPANDARNLLIEASELQDIFVWVDTDNLAARTADKKDKVCEEASDVLFCLLMLCNTCSTPLEHIVAESLKVDVPALGRVAVKNLQYEIGRAYLHAAKVFNIKDAIDQISISAVEFIKLARNDQHANKGVLTTESKELLMTVFSVLCAIGEYASFDIAAEFAKKMQLNAAKYPTDRVRGCFKKYDEYKAVKKN